MAEQVTGFSFDDVGRASFSTSGPAFELNIEFAVRRLGLRARNHVARLALARSLAVPEAPEPCDDASGNAIKGNTLFGDGIDARTWVALLIEHAEMEHATVADLQDLVRRHWARGIRLLDEDWLSCEGDHDRFILRLAAQAGLRADGGLPTRKRTGSNGQTRFEPKPVPVRLPIGPHSIDLKTGEKVEFALNAKGSAPHIAIMGKSGTGKSVVARAMAEAAHAQSGVPVLVFDMGKGDLAGNADFVNAIGAQILLPPRNPVPLDVLYVPAGDSNEATKAALRFRESVNRVPQNSQLGDVQKALVGEAAERALKGNRPVKLSDVQDRLREIYAEKRRKDDLATTTFDDLSKFKLFDPRMSPAEFFSRSWVVDVHTLPELAQRVVVFLILDAAYAYLNALGDSERDPEGNQALRLMIFVDEARRVLSYDQASLIGLVRESRSQGGAVMMVSQSPEDFSKSDDDFLEQIGLGVCFNTTANASVVNRMFGKVDLAGLKSGEAITRLANSPSMRVQAWDEGSFRR